MTATLTKWYEEHGRHEIFAGGKQVDLASAEHHLVLDPVAVAAGIQTDLDDQGIAKNARQEKLRARADRLKRRPKTPDVGALPAARAEGRGTAGAHPDPRDREVTDVRPGDHSLRR